MARRKKASGNKRKLDRVAIGINRYVIERYMFLSDEYDKVALKIANLKKGGHFQVNFSTLNNTLN